MKPMPVTYVDLSHPIRSGMPVIPGLPVPRIEAWRSHAASRSTYGGLAEFEITRLFMVGNTGTYLDSPYHRDPGAADIAGLRLEAVAGLDGVVLDGVPSGRAVGFGADAEDLGGRAVLVRTGWDARFDTPGYWTDGPFLAVDAVERLVAAGAALVGVDFSNVDDLTDLARPAHTALLRAGIPIVEHLRGLERLPRSGFRFFAPPVAVVGAAALPVRAFAEVRS